MRNYANSIKIVWKNNDYHEFLIFILILLQNLKSTPDKGSYCGFTVYVQMHNFLPPVL